MARSRRSFRSSVRNSSTLRLVRVSSRASPDLKDRGLCREFSWHDHRLESTVLSEALSEQVDSAGLASFSAGACARDVPGMAAPGTKNKRNSPHVRVDSCCTPFLSLSSTSLHLSLPIQRSIIFCKLLSEAKAVRSLQKKYAEIIHNQDSAQIDDKKTNRGASTEPIPSTSS